MQKILLVNAIDLPMDIVNIIKDFAFLDAITGKSKKIKNEITKEIKQSNITYSRLYEMWTWERKVERLHLCTFEMRNGVNDEEIGINITHMTSHICKLCGDYVSGHSISPHEITKISCFCPRDVNRILWYDPDYDNDDPDEYMYDYYMTV